MSAVAGPSQTPARRARGAVRAAVVRRPALAILVVLYLIAASCARTPGTTWAAAAVLLFLGVWGGLTVRAANRAGTSPG